jgi:hypothetical protein
LLNLFSKTDWDKEDLWQWLHLHAMGHHRQLAAGSLFVFDSGTGHLCPLQFFFSLHFYLFEDTMGKEDLWWWLHLHSLCKRE